MFFVAHLLAAVRHPRLVHRRSSLPCSGAVLGGRAHLVVVGGQRFRRRAAMRLVELLALSGVVQRFERVARRAGEVDVDREAAQREVREQRVVADADDRGVLGWGRRPWTASTARPSPA